MSHAPGRLRGNAGLVLCREDAFREINSIA